MRLIFWQGIPSLVKPLGILCSLLLLAQSVELAAQPQHTSALADQFKTLNKASTWTLASQTPLAFDTFHPQGMVKVGAHFFLSSVETIEAPVSITDSTTAFDRTAGIGVGHLFKFTAAGALVAHVTLGERAIYHPGGIDFDGESLWVSVAEYRPNSHSIVYKVDPETLASSEVLRFDDHLGAIVRDNELDTLHAVSWGSRRIYSWQGSNGKYSAASPTLSLNPSHYIDYQDCQYLTGRNMLCGGLSSYRDDSGSAFKLGGIDLIDLGSMQPEFQLPIIQTTASGALLTQNPFYAEVNGAGDLMFYFVPEDDQSSLYVYRVK